MARISGSVSMPDKVIYTVGGTVQASGGTYISRDADEELLRSCRAGEFCYVLTARQMGKSSLMVATKERLATEGIHSVEIDLTEMGSKLSGLTAEQWYLGLMDLIVNQLDLDIDYMAWWDERAHLGPTQRLSQFLRQVMLEQVSEPVVIFIDEIDSTLNLDFTDDFFAAIRACYNARASDPAFKRLSFVLLGVATPTDLISDPQRTPFNIGRRVDLADFTERQAIPLADGLGLPPVEAGQILTWILDWTEGHPYLTQRLCAAAADSPTRTWDAAAVEKLVEKTFLGEQSAQDHNLRFVRDMLTQRAPDKAAVLKTYRRIHADKAVLDEERSLVKMHLKLSGVVKRKEGNLAIRNRIYDQVFNQEWIGQNMPRDWARRIAVISTILVLVLGGLFGYYRTYIQPQQTTEARAQAFIDNFRGTTSADVQITSLAGLFELSGYENRAKQLFYEELSPGEQRALFEKADPQGVGTQLVTVVKGLYVELENNDQDNQLLEAMAQPLHELDDPMAMNLVTEIVQWLTGHKAYAAGEYQQAVNAYSVAISLNDRNPGTYFDRGLAYAALGEPSQALADFETVLSLEEDWEERVRQAIERDGQLYAALWSERGTYQTLVALVPTPTSTPTSTAIPTPVPLAATPTWTSTNTPVPSTSTDMPTATPTVTPSPTRTPTPGIRLIPDNFYATWITEDQLYRSDDTRIRSKRIERAFQLTEMLNDRIGQVTGWQRTLEYWSDTVATPYLKSTYTISFDVYTGERVQEEDESVYISYWLPISMEPTSGMTITLLGNSWRVVGTERINLLGKEIDCWKLLNDFDILYSNAWWTYVSNPGFTEAYFDIATRLLVRYKQQESIYPKGVPPRLDSEIPYFYKFEMTLVETNLSIGGED
jgi:tetratricopeptide (TPR) repeat protein